MQKSMGASVGYHLTGEGNLAPAAPPPDQAGFGGGLVPAAVATTVTTTVSPGNYQAKRIVAVVVAPTAGTSPRWDVCEEEEEPVGCCRMGAAQRAVEVARHRPGGMKAAAATHILGTGRAHEAAGRVARRHRRILSVLRAAAEEAADAARFPPRDATCRSCRSSGFSARHP